MILSEWAVWVIWWWWRMRWGQRSGWPRVELGTTVLTTSCERVPVGCGGHSYILWSQSSDQIQITHQVHQSSTSDIGIKKTTHINFAQNDIHHAADDDDEVKDVPGVSEVALQQETRHSLTGTDTTDQWKTFFNLYFEGHKFKDHLHGKQHSKDQVQRVWKLGHMVRLVAVLLKTGRNVSPAVAVNMDCCPCWGAPACPGRACWA